MPSSRHTSVLSDENRIHCGWCYTTLCRAACCVLKLNYLFPAPHRSPLQPCHGTQVNKSSDSYHFSGCVLLSIMPQEWQSKCSLIALGALQSGTAHPSQGLWSEKGQMFTQSSSRGWRQGCQVSSYTGYVHSAGLALEEYLKSHVWKQSPLPSYILLTASDCTCKLVSLMWSIKCLLLKTNKLWECYLFPHLPLF